MTPTDAAPHRHLAGHRSIEPRQPVSRLFAVLVLAAALVVFAGVYVAGSTLHSQVLHDVALLGTAGALITTFMTAALDEH